MSWLNSVLTRLADATAWGYAPDGPTMAEPAALTALALIAHGRQPAARRPLDWLVKQQAGDGGVGTLSGDPDPAWPTAWAVLAWQAADSAQVETADAAGSTNTNATQIKRAVDWLLQPKGAAVEESDALGHNPALIGWPWVQGTHSWIEPTALAVLALKSAGHATHPRTTEAVRLLIDRLLPDGGCNYGNTVVLGQTLRPHIQPTGICLWALAGEPDVDGRIARSIDYLTDEVPEQTGTASLCYALLGLAAHGVRPSQADSWLVAAAERTIKRNPAAYRLALLALAAPHARNPMLPDTLPSLTHAALP